MFSHSTDALAVLLPDLFDALPTPDGLILSLGIPPNLAYFDGHFQQIAVVPGVVQIQWAIHFARQHLGLELTFSHMEAIKFKNLLLPNQLLQLELRYLQAAGKLEFRYHAAADEFSSGRIYFHEHNL